MATNLTPDQMTVLANEAQRQAAALALAGVQGQMAALASAAQVIGSLSSDAAKQFATANAALQALQVGNGPGITSDFGPYSSIDQLLRTERFAGKSACIDFVKANPACTLDQAVQAWTTAAMAATGLPAPVVPPANYQGLYAANLHAAGLIPDTTWASQAAWIAATEKSVIMGS